MVFGFRSQQDKDEDVILNELGKIYTQWELDTVFKEINRVLTWARGIYSIKPKYRIETYAQGIEGEFKRFSEVMNKCVKNWEGRVRIDREKECMEVGNVLACLLIAFEYQFTDFRFGGGMGRAGGSGKKYYQSLNKEEIIRNARSGIHALREYEDNHLREKNKETGFLGSHSRFLYHRFDAIIKKNKRRVNKEVLEIMREIAEVFR